MTARERMIAAVDNLPQGILKVQCRHALSQPGDLAALTSLVEALAGEVVELREEHRKIEGAFEALAPIIGRALNATTLNAASDK